MGARKVTSHHSHIFSAALRRTPEIVTVSSPSWMILLSPDFLRCPLQETHEGTRLLIKLFWLLKSRWSTTRAVVESPNSQLITFRHHLQVCGPGPISLNRTILLSEISPLGGASSCSGLLILLGPLSVVFRCSRCHS